MPLIINKLEFPDGDVPPAGDTVKAGTGRSTPPHMGSRFPDRSGALPSRRTVLRSRGGRETLAAARQANEQAARHAQGQGPGAGNLRARRDDTLKRGTGCRRDALPGRFLHSLHDWTAPAPARERPTLAAGIDPAGGRTWHARRRPVPRGASPRPAAAGRAAFACLIACSPESTGHGSCLLPETDRLQCKYHERADTAATDLHHQHQQQHQHQLFRSQLLFAFMKRIATR